MTQPLAGAARRRGKAAMFVILCSWVGVAPHWLDPPRNLLPALSLSLLIATYVLRTVLRPLWSGPAGKPAPAAAAPGQAVETLSGQAGDWPLVDVVVAARDEEAVIGRLVERVGQLSYPAGRIRLWVIDDGSEDRTAELLAELEGRTPQLTVIRRSREAGGGKSGALNAVLEQLQGRWMLVLDADAGLQADLLERLVPFAESAGWSAVQLRKAVVNTERNLLTRAQAMEMALDAGIQEGRVRSGGIGELRGNGQLLRRDVLEACGGFNEATVTDDLDLSFRLLLAGHPVGVLWDPPVEEEAVLNLASLWKQRQRWAEGGLQRFFDYGPGLISSRLSRRQRVDLAVFFFLQYALPLIAAFDLFAALLSGTSPAIWPLSFVAISLTTAALVIGCRRPSEGPPLPALNPFSVLLAMTYFTHWLVVIPLVAVRMAVMPKRLVWAKTLHLGSHPDQPADGEDGQLPSDSDLSTQTT
ncbi:MULTISPECIES: glycosyltransferase [Synechococcales]|uniref:glycosyltransferase n=2 Tax=Synechococcus TaxID=1129 RepID=UPI0037DA2015